MQSTLCFIDRWSNNQSSKAQAGSENCRSQSKLPANFTQYTRRMPHWPTKGSCTSYAAGQHLSTWAAEQQPQPRVPCPKPRWGINQQSDPSYLSLLLSPHTSPLSLSSSACSCAQRCGCRLSFHTLPAIIEWMLLPIVAHTRIHPKHTHTRAHTHRHNQLISSNSMRALLKAIRASVDQIKAEIVY